MTGVARKKITSFQESFSQTNTKLREVGIDPPRSTNNICDQACWQEVTGYMDLSPLCLSIAKRGMDPSALLVFTD